MQSGITASAELLTAFNNLVSDPTQRGLLASIQNESLIPLSILPASTSFSADLAQIATSSLKPDIPLYILLRQHETAPDGFVAVTYIPDAAPVRQKTLFAATRLTLVRALGAERFRTTRFVTEPAELEPAGWLRHERAEAAEGPLTAEEKVLQGVKDEEELGKNTTDRRQLVGGRVKVGISAEARVALEAWGRGEGENLVQLLIDIQSETIQLASTNSATAADLATTISATEPRFSFFRYNTPPPRDQTTTTILFSDQDQPSGGHHHPSSSSSSSPQILIFIFTCPPETKIKARMVYASSKLTFLAAVKEELGLVIEKKLEISSPLDLTSQTIADEFEFAERKDERSGFLRPKRPGRR